MPLNKTSNKKVHKLKPLVSVIVNCLNGQKYLKKAIRSVINQTYRNWEIVFWDNSSSDKSKSIIKTFAKKDSRISYYYSSKQTSLNDARNSAIKKCRGELITFLDCDDYYHKTKLCEQVNIFNQKNVAFCFCNFFIKNKKKKQTAYCFKKNFLVAKNQLIKTDIVVGCLSLMLRKSKIKLFKKPFFPNGLFLGDFILVHKLNNISEGYYLSKTLCTYRVHSTSQLALRTKQAIENEVCCLLKKFSKNKLMQNKLLQWKYKTLFALNKNILCKIKYSLMFLATKTCKNL